MCRLASHVLGQQSFAPLFPNPAMPLDLRQSRHLTLSRSPDVLLLPSRLAPLAQPLPSSLRTEDGEPLDTLLVNPGSLVRGRGGGGGGGTFAVLDIHPLPEEPSVAAGDPEELLPHQVASRTKVQIIKI